MKSEVATAIQGLLRLKKMYVDLIRRIGLLRSAADAYPMEDLCDTACVLREISQVSDDIRKEASLLKDRCEKTAVFKWVKQGLNNPDELGPIKGELAMGTPNIKTMVPVPKPTRDPEAYIAMMLELGVDLSAVEQDLVRPHWPGLVDYLTLRQEQGLPTPECLKGKTQYEIMSLNPLRRLPRAEEIIESLEEMEPCQKIELKKSDLEEESLSSPIGFRKKPRRAWRQSRRTSYPRVSRLFRNRLRTRRSRYSVRAM